LNPFSPWRCGGAARRRAWRETDEGAPAKFFVATIQGMRAMARLKSDRRALRQVAKIDWPYSIGFETPAEPVNPSDEYISMRRYRAKPQGMTARLQCRSNRERRSKRIRHHY